MTSIFKCHLLYTEKGFTENCFLVEEDGVVKSISHKIESQASLNDVNVYELDGVVIPSLVNAHTHLELTDKEEKFCEKDRIELWDWIIEIIKYKRTLTEDDYVHNISFGEKKLYKAGTAIVADIRSACPKGSYLNNLKGVIFFEVLGYIEQLFQQKFDLLKQFIQSHKDSNNFIAGLSIHSLYTTPFSKAKDLVKFARSNKMPIMMHLAETDFEDRLFFNNDEDGFHKIFSEADFERMNFRNYAEVIDFLSLGDDTFLVHCVNFTKKDWLKVKERGVKIVLCPMSNLFWSDKLPDFREVISIDIDFILGTDSSKTNGNMDVLKEARFMYNALNQKDAALKILNAVTYKGRKLLNSGGVGVEEGDICSFLFFPIKCNAKDAAEYILSESIEPIVYQKEFKDEAFELFKK